MAAGLDFSNLDTAVQELFSVGLAASTRRTYQSGSECFVQFCRTFAVTHPFPVSERTLTYFVAYLYQEKLAASTVKSYMAAVRHTQIALGLVDPGMGRMSQLEYVVKGLKRQTSGRPAQTRLPITPEILLCLK